MIAATTLPITWAKKAKPEPGLLADFKGAYARTVTYNNVLAGFSGTGATSIVVTPAKNGRSGTIVLAGSAVINGNAQSVNETLTYSGNILAVLDFAPGIVAPMGIAGPFQADRKGTTFTSNIG